MMSKIKGNSDTISHPSDSHDNVKKLNRVDTFVDRGQRDQEPYRRPDNKKLIKAGDSIIGFLINFVKKNFGGDSYVEGRPLPPAFFYTLRMLDTYDEFIEFIQDSEIDVSQIPADVEEYANKDLVDWICKQAGVTRDLFERIEDLCWESSDGASSDVLRLFQKNWYSGMFNDTVRYPWIDVREQLS